MSSTSNKHGEWQTAAVWLRMDNFELVAWTSSISLLVNIIFLVFFRQLRYSDVQCSSHLFDGVNDDTNIYVCRQHLVDKELTDLEQTS